MKPYLLLLLPFVACAGLASANQQAGPSSANERLRQIRRDLPLIESLVEEALQLAHADEPLKRAQACQRLAGGFAAEMSQAVTSKDGPRATSLSENLKVLLDRGVALNLGLAQSQKGQDEVHQHEVKRSRDETLNLIVPLQNLLEQPAVRDQDNMRAVLDNLSEARSGVESALRAKTPGSLKVPPVGKKAGSKKPSS